MAKTTGGFGLDNALSFESPQSLFSSELQQYAPDYRPGWHQLLIIGNGFDLECGLPSKFKDFYEPRHEAMLSYEEEYSNPEVPWGRLLKDDGLTIWDVILADEAGEYWCNIEAALRDWIAPEYDCAGGNRKAGSLLKAIKEANCDSAGDDQPGSLVSDVLLARAFRYVADNIDASETMCWTADTLLDYLFLELHDLERQFASYLNDAVARAEGYANTANELLFTLLLDERASEKDYRIDESILSFNYTRPANHLDTDTHEINLVNVHGRLGSEIVFGIDGKDLPKDSGELRFTKTYRLMALDVPNVEKLIWPHALGLDGGTSLIKFYGHSLSEADYSYFQAIFDSVGLYDSSTRLIFYYKPREDASASRDSMMKKVFHLLDIYGNTMDNPDHGKNLIHKLLLEGRLSVKPLPERTVRRKQ